MVHVVGVLAEPDPRDDLEHVERHRVFLVESRPIDVLRVGEEALQAGDLLGAALRRRVGQAVVVTLVAQDGRVDRLARQEPLPEAVGKVENRTLALLLPPQSYLLSAEQRQLLGFALYLRIEPEQRRELIEVGLLTAV